MYKDFGIIGAGVAGLTLAEALGELGFSGIILEKETTIGGKLNTWSDIGQGEVTGKELCRQIAKRLKKYDITILTSATAGKISERNGAYEIANSKTSPVLCRTIILATGFEFFDARRKEEYGYGIYPQVLTSSEADKAIASGQLFGAQPKPKAGFLHCVGSRDEKVRAYHCSKLCCMTAIRQAIAVKKRHPESEVYCFYMDIRAFDCGYEEMYREAQEKWGVRFIRGRISEVSETPQGSLQIKTEDTLMGRPMRMTLDRLILMTGMQTPEYNKTMFEGLNIPRQSSGFLIPQPNLAVAETPSGLFAAGAGTGPKTLSETIDNARSVALSAARYLCASECPQEAKIFAYQADNITVN